MDISDLVREMTKLVKGKRSKNGDVADYGSSEMSGAIGQQLGLSLKLRRGPVELLVIDHAEKHRRRGTLLVNGPSRSPLAMAFAEPWRKRFPPE